MNINKVILYNMRTLIFYYTIIYVMTKADVYETLAKYYDAIYELKDYEGESKILKQLIKQYKKSVGKELLDIACGTGVHLSFLKKEFTCTGTDLNAGMIAVAKKKQPDIHFEVSDMAELNLGKKFDVITCLFSSIGYIISKERLSTTIKGFANHLKSGGVLLIEQWLDKAIFRAGEPHITTHQSKDFIITRVNTSEVKGEVSIFDMHYLVAERGKEVKHFVEHHELAMYPTELFLSLMAKNNLVTTRFQEDPKFDRGLLIGVKK